MIQVLLLVSQAGSQTIAERLVAVTAHPDDVMVAARSGVRGWLVEVGTVKRAV